MDEFPERFGRTPGDDDFFSGEGATVPGDEPSSVDLVLVRVVVPLVLEPAGDLVPEAGLFTFVRP